MLKNIMLDSNYALNTYFSNTYYSGPIYGLSMLFSVNSDVFFYLHFK